MKRLGNEEGATLVEFALASLALIMMLFGIIEFSFAFYSYNFAAEAAKEAARYASVRGVCKDSNGNVTNLLPDCAITPLKLKELVQNMGYPGINPSNITAVDVTWPNGDGYPGHSVKVDITYKFPLSVPFWNATDLYLHSTAQMVISN
jgi:Flp pilus assembly protein TadG